MTLLACEEMVVTGISGVSQSTCCFPKSHFGLSLSMKGLIASQALCSSRVSEPAARHLPELSPSQRQCWWAVTALPQGTRHSTEAWDSARGAKLC